MLAHNAALRCGARSKNNHPRGDYFGPRRGFTGCAERGAAKTRELPALQTRSRHLHWIIGLIAQSLKAFGLRLCALDLQW